MARAQEWQPWQGPRSTLPTGQFSGLFFLAADASGNEVSNSSISVSDDLVTWQSFPNLKILDQRTGSTEEIATEFDVSGGVTLAVAGEWVVAASPNCQKVLIYEVASKIATHLELEKAFEGGTTSLVALGGEVFCGSYFGIERFDLETKQSESVWTAAGEDFVVGDLQEYEEQLLLVETPFDRKNSQRLSLLDRQGVSNSVFAEVPTNSLYAASGDRLFAKPWSLPGHVSEVVMSDGSLKAYPGETPLDGNFVAGGGWVYWAARTLDEGDPNGIYRQKIQ